MILTFPGGQEVDVQFDDAQHTYVVAHKLANGEFSDYRPTHGITAPLATIPKPFLKPWAAKEGVHAALAYIRDNPAVAEQLPQFFEDLALYESKAIDPATGKTAMTYYRFTKNWGWVSKAKGAFKDKSGDGKEIGTWLHTSIENFYNSGRKTLPINTDATQGMWDSFIAFDNFFKPKPEMLEFLVYSLLFGYSGQGDFRGDINGKFCVGDWKSTNRSDFNPDGIEIDYFFQTGGLAQAEFERTGKWVDDMFVANFDKKGGEPRVIFASEFGMSPQDAARAYITAFNNHHMYEDWDYKFKKR